MAKFAFILLLALCALFAVCSARPIIFVAQELGSNLANVTNGWSGITMVLSTLTKGRLNHRLRFYGTDNINDTLSKAWLTFTNGTIIANLNVSTNASSHYINGDIRVNETIYFYLLNDQLGVVVASKKFPKGAIAGTLHAKPNTAVTFLNGAQVVPTPVSSNALGLGFTYLADPSPLPLDLVTQTNLVLNNASFTSRVLYFHVTNATTITFNAPANFTQTAPVLATLTNDARFSAFLNGFQPVTSDFYSQQFELAYLQVNSQANPNGAIRGQLYPTTSRTRRQPPYAVETIEGNTDAQNGLNTLRFSNQQGKENNPGSYVSLQATQASNGTGNYTYQGFFKFNAPASRRNFDGIRGYTVDLNLRQFGNPSPWQFDFFDASTGIHVPFATFASPGLWTNGFADYFNSDASTFPNNRGQLIIRVTVNSASPTSLFIDLFGLRSYVSDSDTNLIVKPIILNAQLLPSKSS
jgi:hypothetical protein